MGFLNSAATLVAVTLPLWAVRCTDESRRFNECKAACEWLRCCELLPSPLGTGSDPAANCAERCSVADQSEDGVFDKVVVQCAPKAVVPDRCESCDVTASCGDFAECLSGEFPGQSPGGVGEVEVRIGIQPARSVESRIDCLAPRFVTAPDPADCLAAGLTNITLFSLPTALEPLDMAQLKKSCSDALRTPFPTVRVRAGSYEPKLKLIGFRPRAPVTLDGGVTALDAGPDDRYETPMCRVFTGSLRRIAAGKTTRVDVAIPGDWATSSSSSLRPCEDDPDGPPLNCFDTADNDGDGPKDCNDESCKKACSTCRLTSSENGDLLPDCTEPTCPCFVASSPDDAGMGGNSSAGGAGGAGEAAADDGEAGAGGSSALDASDASESGTN